MLVYELLANLNFWSAKLDALRALRVDVRREDRLGEVAERRALVALILPFRDAGQREFVGPRQSP